MWYNHLDKLGYAEEQIMKGKISLKEVNYENYDELIDLRVKVDQRNFVASNIYSLAEAYAVIASKGRN